MEKINTIAIFDIGKTNKKFFLLNESYNIVLEKTVQFAEIEDEDGDACEDVLLLTNWVQSTIREALQLPEFNIRAVNFSTYGASFVYLDESGAVVAPLYNYLKDYPSGLREQFYERYGGTLKISLETASPVLGNLNSG
ncbi:MAG: carbohydrate kinase, partial [Pedobacter sp.]